MFYSLDDAVGEGGGSSVNSVPPVCLLPKVMLFLAAVCRVCPFPPVCTQTDPLCSLQLLCKSLHKLCTIGTDSELETFLLTPVDAQLLCYTGKF